MENKELDNKERVTLGLGGKSQVKTDAPNSQATTLSAPNKITLKRKKTTKLVNNDGKLVNVVVHKKRTYKKRPVEPETPDIADEHDDVIEALAPQENESNVVEDVTAEEQAAKLNDSSIDAVAAQSNGQDEAVIEEVQVESSAKNDKEVNETTSVNTGDKTEESPAGKAKKDKAKKKSKEKFDDTEEDSAHKRNKAAAKKETKSRAKNKRADVDYFIEEDDELFAADASTPAPKKRARVKKRKKMVHSFSQPVQQAVRDIEIPKTIIVADLAQKLALKSGQVVKALMKMDVMANLNQVIDQDTAVLVVEELGHKAKIIDADLLETNLEEQITHAAGSNIPRAPVVTIMGHVDHGKTSLLDYIRSTKITSGEAGGITQHIGAYTVSNSKGNITFLDTPGHAAFTAMRSRGANCTDIVILVVAADDGVMPQTVEAIKHAKAAQVPIIVAINKIDKEEADLDRVRNELSQHDVISEDWGGDVMFVPVSAKTGQGVPDLLDSVLLLSELQELSVPGSGPAKCIVIESRLDKGRGVITTLLVQQGILNKGDIVVTGTEFGRIRAMYDDAGNSISKAGPSIPVEVLGFSATPSSGDSALVTATEKQAKDVVAHRKNKLREAQLLASLKDNIDDIFANVKNSDGCSTLNILIKADVHGSSEALNDSLKKLENDEVKLNVISNGVGGINESDITLAKASNAIIIGFNVRADSSAKKLAEEENIKLNYYSVIYDVIDMVKAALSGLLAPEIKEIIMGVAEVRDVFRSMKYGSIAGCMVIDGIIKRNAKIRVLRDNVVIYEGELESLRSYKEDVSEVRNGAECGIGVKNYNDIKVKDSIEVFETKEIARTI